MEHPALVFLDRDGTIIEDAHFISRPEDVRVLPGAAGAIARLNAAGIPVVVVTNQSGIGRGYFGIAEYEQVAERIAGELEKAGARIDAVYYCPHAPSDSDPCPCRKPGTALFDAALAKFGIPGSRAAFVGDRVRDVSPALPFGGAGYLIVSDQTTPEDVEWAGREAITVNSLGEAVDRMLGLTDAAARR
ncbi:MAG TPA: HAD family hydrolase [Gemmatimonadaceae bacterium]|nr:HAD family hydrolase [Gemmatimonadaceae bacterium]